MQITVVNLGGTLCLRLPAGVFGINTIDSSAMYDAAVREDGIDVTFSLEGSRTLHLFGLVASSQSRAVSMTSVFGVEVQQEATQLGWPAGTKVEVSVVSPNSLRVAKS